MKLTRRAALQFLCLAVGAFAGFLGGDRVDRINTFHSGQADLSQYANRLQQNAIEISRQSAAAIKAVQSDHFEFCSPDEISFMRGIVYNSSQIKDIGRLRGRLFYCSSETGRSAEPFLVPVPDNTFRDFSIYPSSPVMFGQNARGFVIQVGSANVVLNPHAYDQFRESPRLYAAYLYDEATRTVVQAYGDKLPLTPAEIVSLGVFQKARVLYVPLCSVKAHICVVAAEPVASIMSGSDTRGILLFFGSALGLSLAATGLLFYRRHRSQARQLRRALQKKTLTLVYQPIVSLSSGAIVAAEALLRWTNEDNEIVSPAVLIPLAEENGLLKEVTRFVLDRALEELGGTLRGSALRVTVNITSEDISDPAFFPFLKDCLKRHGLNAASIGLELTERSTSSVPEFSENIASLRAAGHTIYVDDFGTGYSSLSYLRDLAIDAIKIDRSFTASIGTRAITEPILPQILRMAELLDLNTVIEGVETVEQAAFFVAFNQTIWAQGWFFGRPQSAQEFLRTVAAGAGEPTHVSHQP